MSKLVTELLGRLFLALADLTAVNHHVVVAGDAIELEGREKESLLGRLLAHF